VYGWIWCRLPEPWPLRLVIAFLLLLGMVALFMGLVFPWVESCWLIDDPRLWNGP
jgi:hypothetical protein